MRPYSWALRERIAAAVDHHDGSIRWIARVFRVSTSFLVRPLRRRRAAGTRAPTPRRGGPPPALGLETGSASPGWSASRPTRRGSP
jgi:transposase